MSAIEAPSEEALTELIGARLLEVWQTLDATINRATTWNKHGARAARNGRTNTSTAGAARHFAACMPKATASDS